MENNERDRKLDQWLDEALSQYSAAEPRLGLEQRVLAHVAAEEKARAGRRSIWRWMPAFAAIAAVLIVMVAVRPYWETKTRRTALSSQAAPAATAQGEASKVDSANHAQPASQPPVAANKTAPTSKARDEMSAAESRAPISKDSRVDNLRMADSAHAAVPAAAPVVSNAFDTDSARSAKEGKESAALDSRRDNTDRRTYSTILTVNSPVPPQPTRQKTAAVGGLVSGNVATGAPAARSADAAYGAPMQAQTIEVSPTEQKLQNLGAPTLNDKVATAAPSAQTMTMKATPVGPLAKKLEENVDTLDIVGMTKLRTNLKNVPPGPAQQFPSPVPLSEQEKLMLKAAKQMKAKSANDAKQDSADGQLKDIEIKNIEIAPLPGPPK